VESVAWVAERKDVLSAFFLAPHAVVLMRSYVAARRAPLSDGRAGILSRLMAKPMIVTLPLAAAAGRNGPCGAPRGRSLGC